MPVLFGLFYALSSVLRNANLQSINSIIYPFLPHFSSFPNIDLNWFTFLNPSWHFSLGTPDPTHVLPILAALATYVQLRMSQPKTAAVKSATPDPMASQMKMMQLLSPAMVLFFGWNYAAGLALYWTVSSLFAIVQQYFVTGWGSLLVTPNLPGLSGNSASNSNNGNNKSYTDNRSKETKVLTTTEEPKRDGVVQDGPISRKLQTNNGGSAAQRRRSASARRRSGNNMPKRNPSRS
jgi:YidC/Oxa1 family membrane protein insertase